MGFKGFGSLSAYLPLMLMALLAAFTTWLVRQTPAPHVVQATRIVRHEPDYEMTTFKVQRFGADGHLKVEITGDRLRHYPDTRLLEIDNPHIRGIGPERRITHAWAKQATANDDGNELRLKGGARVVRESAVPQETIEFHSEFLLALLKTEEVSTHLPVVFQSGSTQIRADGVHYRHRDQLLQFQGAMKAVFTPLAPGAREGLAP
jgi:lipopolysaccharide export system protein LptC